MIDPGPRKDGGARGNGCARRTSISSLLDLGRKLKDQGFIVLYNRTTTSSFP
jgi:hypothetical protein